jgi:hypothetical protein
MKELNSCQNITADTYNQSKKENAVCGAGGDKQGGAFDKKEHGQW